MSESSQPDWAGSVVQTQAPDTQDVDQEGEGQEAALVLPSLLCQSNSHQTQMVLRL